MALSRAKRDEKMKALERLDRKTQFHTDKVLHHEEALERIETERQQVLDELAADEHEMYQQRQLVRRELDEFRQTLAPRNALRDPFGTTGIEEADRRLQSIRPQLSPGIFVSGAHKFAMTIHPVVFPNQATYNKEGSPLWYWLQKMRAEAWPSGSLPTTGDWQDEYLVDFDDHNEHDKMEEAGPARSVPPTWVWDCLLYTSPSPRDGLLSRMPSSA